VSEIGLGIVGCGWAAGELARAAKLLAGISIETVYDTDRSRAEALASKTGAAIAADFAALLANPRVNAVYVGLPHHLLAPTVEAALTAGRHVLAEKPLALDAATARRLGRLAEEGGLRLAVFFELRRAGTVAMAKRLIADGAIGGPRLIRLRTLIEKPLSYWGPAGAPNWRGRRAEAGGGVVMMNTIHQLDTLRYITGLEFTGAMGRVTTLTAPVEVEDAAAATLHLSNGALVSLVASAHSPGADHGETIEIDGSLGRLDIPDPFGKAPLRLYDVGKRSWSDVPVERPDSHALMLAAFIASVREGTPVPAGASDAAAALAAVAAIYRSSAEGRAIDI
jgi:predicted dehydrogenase